MAHAHRANNITFDCNSIAAITCGDFDEGREIAFDIFKGQFGSSYSEAELTPEFLRHFPRGIFDAN